MIACGEAFIPSTTQSCSIVIEGVAGNLEVRMMGTAELIVQNNRGRPVILQVANTLQSPGCHNLISLAQIQMNPLVKVKLTNEAPSV